MKNVIGIVIFLVFIGLSTWFMSTAVHDLDRSISKVKGEKEAMIGQIYVMDGDSLTIVDYSIWNGTYTLSSGVVIHKSLIK